MDFDLTVAGRHHRHGPRVPRELRRVRGGEHAVLFLHMRPDLARASLELFAAKVLPTLQTDLHR
ncbi:MAG TPA: hypothetical protein VGX23_16280 [Actinocrinis sp.]|nr:hypothetical protein [Actinocrinis sp.]